MIGTSGGNEVDGERSRHNRLNHNILRKAKTKFEEGEKSIFFGRGVIATNFITIQC